MNLNFIVGFLEKNLSRPFHTFSTCSAYFASFDNNYIKIKTEKKNIFISLESFIALLVDVISEKSFIYKTYKSSHKNVSYTLPIIKELMDESEEGINYEQPKGGFKNISLIMKAEALIKFFDIENETTTIQIQKYLNGTTLSSIDHKASKRKTVKSYLTELISSKDIECLQSEREYIKSDLLIGERIMYGGGGHEKRKKEQDKKFVYVPINYITNRKPDRQSFGGDPDSELHYGTSSVSIPKTHKSGNVERPLSIFKVKLKEKKSKHFTIEKTEKISKSEFYKNINTSNCNSLMLFIHGYNVKFEDAVFKTAQIKYDLDYHDPIILFSWPSRGGILSYLADKENATYSAEQLSTILNDINLLDIGEVLIIAHSMGAYCLSEAINRLKTNGQIISRLALAAADINQHAFKNLYKKSIKKVCGNVSLYVSNTDKALISSNLMNQEARVGDTRNGVCVIDGLDTVDMTNTDAGFLSLNHSYITENNQSLDDLHKFLLIGLPAKKRRLKQKTNKDHKVYWSLHPA